MKIDLRIDRLSLQGVDPSTDADEVAAAIEAELEHLSELHPLPFDPQRAGIDLGRVSFEMPPGADAAEIGRSIARRLVTSWYRSAGSLPPFFDRPEPAIEPTVSSIETADDPRSEDVAAQQAKRRDDLRFPASEV